MIQFFQKSTSPFKARFLRTALFGGALLFLNCGSSWADDPDTERSTLVGLKKSSDVPFPPLTGLSLYQSDTTMKGIFRPQLNVSGKVRFLTIYRNMDKSYDDMITSDKNISFLDYPIANVGASNFGGYPLLELNLQAKLSNSFNFNVGYSFGQAFTGSTDYAAARSLSSRQNLYFVGNLNTSVANFSISAGSVLWTSMSRFTMGQPNYRDDYFVRVPWDWYHNSFQRYDEYYTASVNLGSEAAGRSPFQGFLGTVNFYKIGLKVSSLFGRTNRNVGQANQTNYFPSYTAGTRIEKSIFSRTLDGMVGLNVYSRAAKLSKGDNINDLNQIVSVDGRLRVKKVIFKGELGACRIDNPSLHNTTGYGILLGTELDKRFSPVPVGIEFYNIGYNFASIDGSVMNTNTTVRDGGYATQYIYDNMLLINIAQEVGMIANNRRGINLTGETNIKKLKIQFGMAMSQEIENRHDTITIQHRVNAFSRSRFRPWFQAGGPYARIKSYWMRTFETFTITDDSATSAGYKKGFNTLELLLKYKTKFVGKDLVFLSFHNFNSIQDKFSPIPDFSSNAFVKLYYGDITVAWSVGKKYALEGYAGIERVWGGQRIDLADNNGQRINGSDGKPTYDPNGKTINQLGYGLGLGIDYDVTPNTGLHLRHRWMYQNDNHFTLDTFKGQETKFELIIFF